MKKNLRAVAMFTGFVTAAYALMILGAMVPKQTRYQLTNTKQVVTGREYNALKKPGIKVASNYTILAILLLIGSVPLSVMAFLIVSNRLPEVELEAEEYYKAKRVRKIRTELELETERELCEANKTTTVTAHQKDLESAFIELAEASNWYASESETRQQQQLPAINTQSVNQQAFLPPAAMIESDQTVEPKIPKLTNYPAVLIYGPQGSGKTFLAEEEIRERKQADHRVTALDPHAGFYSWRDCEVIGAGMNYQAIDAELADFASEVKRRYERIRKEPNPQFTPWTFVCDEFTNWASRCKASGDFFQAALSDIRKAKMYVLFVSHARTLAGLGEAKGMAATRDAALLEIELLGQIDPETAEAVPKFEALVKLPGQSQADRTLVKLTKHPEPKNATVDEVSDARIDTYDNSSGKDYTLPEQDSGNLSNLYGKGAEGLNAVETSDASEALEQSLNGFLAEVLAESLPPVFADDFPLKKHERRVQLAKLVISQNLGKQKTIWLLWGVKDGGRNNQRYIDARNMLEKLIGGK